MGSPEARGIFWTQKEWFMKQARCPWTRGMDEENVALIGSGILLSHEKECSNAIYSRRMDPEIIILSEDKDRYQLIYKAEIELQM